MTFKFTGRNRVVPYVDRYDDKLPKEEALGMFRSRIHRAWGHAAIFCLERPHLGSQPQACWPAVARRLRHACLTLRIATSSTPSPRAPNAVFTPVRGERTGTSMSGADFVVKV